MGGSTTIFERGAHVKRKQLTKKQVLIQWKWNERRRRMAIGK